MNEKPDHLQDRKQSENPKQLESEEKYGKRSLFKSILDDEKHTTADWIEIFIISLTDIMSRFHHFKLAFPMYDGNMDINRLCLFLFSQIKVINQEDKMELIDIICENPDMFFGVAKDELICFIIENWKPMRGQRQRQIFLSMALEYAARSQNKPLLKFLVSKGVDVSDYLQNCCKNPSEFFGNNPPPDLILYIIHMLATKSATNIESRQKGLFFLEALDHAIEDKDNGVARRLIGIAEDPLPRIPHIICNGLEDYLGKIKGQRQEKFLLRILTYTIRGEYNFHTYNDLAIIMIEGGVNVNGHDDFGRTPFTCALEVGNEIIVRLMLQKGADLEAGTQYDNELVPRTPLMRMAQCDDDRVDILKLLELLINAGADVSAKIHGVIAFDLVRDSPGKAKVAGLLQPQPPSNEYKGLRLFSLMSSNTSTSTSTSTSTRKRNLAAGEDQGKEKSVGASNVSEPAPDNGIEMLSVSSRQA